MEIYLYEVVFEVAAEDAQSGGETVFPRKVVESKHGFWVNADIWIDARELVRSERQTLQDT